MNWAISRDQIGGSRRLGEIAQNPVRDVEISGRNRRLGPAFAGKSGVVLSWAIRYDTKS
jgi:hypothetical protein